MIPLVPVLAAILLAQTGPAQPGVRVDATPSAPPMPELVVSWVYPRASTSHVIQQNIVPREQDVVRMRTSDPADQVEAYYRRLVVADGGSYSVVSAVNQRIVANAFTVVTIEPGRTDTVITIMATTPEPDAAAPPDPAKPFRTLTKGVRPPPS